MVAQEDITMWEAQGNYQPQEAEHRARYNPTDAYIHVNVTEADEQHDDLASVVIDDAFDTHAQGYEQAGFFASKAAITLDPITRKRRVDSNSIDLAWGKNVLYHVSVNPANVDDKATMRKVRMVNGDPNTLPSYGKFESVLSDGGRAHLNSILESGAEVFEIAALAHSTAGSPEGIHEVVRSEIQRAYLADRQRGQEQHANHPPEKWVFAIVTSTFETFVNRWGKYNFTVIGEDVQVNDERVDNQRVALRPTTLNPSQFFDNIYQSFTETTSLSAKRRLAEELVYMTEGIDDSMLSPNVRLARQQMVTAGVVARKWNASAKSNSTVSNEVISNEPATVWEEPVFVDASTDAGKRRLARINKMPWVQKSDKVSECAAELFAVMHPDQLGNEDAYEAFLASRSNFGPDYGNWVYIPGSREVIHFPAKEDLRRLYTARNEHLVSREEQELLYTKTVFVAGLSVGREIGTQLFMGGVGGKIEFGDPDHLSPTNMGRVRAGFSQVGMSKVDLFAGEISARDPYLEQRQYRHAINAATLEALAPEDRPDIIFDEVDDLRTKAQIRAYAAEHGIPVVMVTDLGTASVIDVERYDLDRNLLPFLGRLNADELAQLLSGEVTDEQMGEYKVRMFDGELLATQPRLMESLRDISSHVLGGGIPQLGSTAALGGSVAVTVARAILTGRELPSGRTVIDPERLLNLPLQRSIYAGQVAVAN